MWRDSWLPGEVIALLLTMSLMTSYGFLHSLVRIARLRPKSTLQSAIGIRHRRNTQKAQGFMGGSFNTRNFSHGVKPRLFRSINLWFMVTVFFRRSCFSFPTS